MIDVHVIFEKGIKNTYKKTKCTFEHLPTNVVNYSNPLPSQGYHSCFVEYNILAACEN
jgi:hypothetical protein